MEHKETLKTGTLVSKLSDSVKAKINNFFTNGVVTSSKVVCGIFFSRDQLFRVEELSVSSGSNFIDDGGLEIEEDSSGDVLSGSSF